MEELNDYELLSYINSNNEEANDLMFEKYKPLIIKISKKYDFIGKKYGFELNDLMQEGMLGLSKAIESYKENMNIKFYTYAKVCIERKIFTLLKNGKREKILNESIPIEDDDYDLNEIIGDNESNPLNIVLSNDFKDNIFNRMYEVLTNYERQVLDLKNEGFKIEEIANILNKTKKQIENTLHRIKNKYKKTIID